MASLDKNAVIGQIDSVLQQCRNIIPAAKYDDFSDQPAEQRTQIVSLLLAAIQRLSPPGSSYPQTAENYEPLLRGNIGAAIGPLQGILKALRADYESGRLQSVVELVHADIFADFLEMADYLLEKGYKDPAAVIIGSVLEEHLRKLCDKFGLATTHAGGAPKKADALNSELYAASVYSKLDQKNVTGWLDLRNKAAHGHYSEYTNAQVSLMLQGVRDFVARHSA